MQNMGTIDRIIRGILGLGLIIAGVVLQLTAGQFWWLALIGAVPLLTATVAVCPLYLPFGLSTKGKKKVDIPS
jgi:hypothetical protein